jgi:hypothetical protein
MVMLMLYWTQAYLILTFVACSVHHERVICFENPLLFHQSMNKKLYEMLAYLSCPRLFFHIIVPVVLNIMPENVDDFMIKRWEILVIVDKC